MVYPRLTASPFVIFSHTAPQSIACMSSCCCYLGIPNRKHLTLNINCIFFKDLKESFFYQKQYIFLVYLFAFWN